MVIANGELKDNINIQPTSSSYIDIGTYKSLGNSIVYSTTLTRTRRNYYDSKNELPEGHRMSTAVEELAIQLGLERAGQDPRKAEVLNDLFGRKNNGWYAFQWTETGLRVPKGYDPNRTETDEQGRKYFQRIILIGDQEVGEVLVPEGSGRAIMEWDEVFGIPRVTSDKAGDMTLENHTTHFYFDANPGQDDKSGGYDVSVARGSDWHHADHARCLGVYAACERWYAYVNDGVRPVQGSLPEITPEFVRIDPGIVEEAKARTITIDDDAANLTARQFKEKYSV
ncbi:MAG: hypothetical protein ABIJ92_02270 [Candidatus Aenigmatarchaeota archaeon]